VWPAMMRVHAGQTDAARARLLELVGEPVPEAGQAASGTTVSRRLAVAVGDLCTAERRLAEALALAAAMPDPPMVARVGVGLADLLASRGSPERAAEVLGASAALTGGPDARHPDVLRLTHALLSSPGGRTAYERATALEQPRAIATLRAALSSG
jgi:hypothetical protein